MNEPLWKLENSELNPNINAIHIPKSNIIQTVSEWWIWILAGSRFGTIKKFAGWFKYGERINVWFWNINGSEFSCFKTEPRTWSVTSPNTILNVVHFFKNLDDRLFFDSFHWRQSGFLGRHRSWSGRTVHLIGHFGCADGLAEANWSKATIDGTHLAQSCGESGFYGAFMVRQH